MFTGLVEQTGRLIERRPRGAGAELVIGHTPWDVPCEVGDSVAVQGICFTATLCHDDRFHCDVLHETLSRTALGAKREGAPLNLERALRLADRLGGHFVTGHIDGRGSVAELFFTGEDWVMRIACGDEILSCLVHKGSVACDGVSLTVADLTAEDFTVHIIPHTWKSTSLSDMRIGDTVNLEGDILAKYARRALEQSSGRGRVLTQLDLEKAGFGQ